MEEQLLKIFQREVERQCKFALIASQDLQKALDVGDSDRIWFSVQAFLGAAGNISKLLWPSNPQIPDRAEKLKESLNVDEDSPIAPRTFRNHFEHFDERLERWANNSARRNFVDSNIGPTNFIAGISKEDFLRNFDTQKGAITYRGDEYLLEPIIDEISKLYDKASEKADNF